MEKATPKNMQFCILSALGMILVVMGHVDEGMLTVGGLFPYYSFHIALFVFISGYFYRAQAEERMGAWLVRKAGTLLLPYFAWNFLYGLLVCLMRAWGFFIGNEPSIRTLFVEPFLSGHQFLYNAPAWFVPALFLAETANLVIRRLLALVRIRNEWVIGGLYLCLGLAVVWLSQNGYVYDWYRIPGRILYMLPCFQMGRLYRTKLEEKDRLPGWLYFGILLAIQLILASTCRGLAVSAAWCNGFLNAPFVPYLTAATGIAFWLRVSRILAPVLEKSRFWIYFGNHTFGVMMHQIAAFFAVKAVFALAAVLTGGFGDFAWESFYTDIYYFYLPGGLEQFKMLYVAAGVALPLLLCRGLDWLERRLPWKLTKILR